MVLICVFVVLLGCCFADIEKPHFPHPEHDPQTDKDHFTHDGHHDSKFDHEAILGTKDENKFADLPPEEAKKRLKQLVNEHDTDHDGIITKEELEAWISLSFKALDVEEAVEKMREEDTSQDGYLTWEEYLPKQFGYNAADIKNLQLKDDPASKEIVQILFDDEERFKTADLDGDSRLNLDEYNAFFHPNNHPHMHDVELRRLLREFDTNKNGYLEKEELVREDSDIEHRVVDEENFKDNDKNGDGKLTDDELKLWALLDVDGSLYREQVDGEANHLIYIADDNRDGKLTVKEILDHYLDFVGGQVTNYGQMLHKYSDEL